MRRGSLFLLLLALLLSPAAAGTLSILSQNMNRLFDDIDDGNNERVISRDRFRKRIETAAQKFGSDFGLPHIIALQEVENLNVLHRIADAIQRRYAARYRALLIPGQDVSGINIGYLVRYDVEIREIDQLLSDASLPGGGPLFSRPPLLLEACYLDKCLALLNLHLRSMRGLDNDSERDRVMRKRRLQAESVARWVNRFQLADAQASLMLLGDFNALTPSDEHVDLIGIIVGNPDNHRTRVPAQDLVEPDLVDLTRLIPLEKRYSYLFRRRKQQLDYVLINQAFAADPISIEFSRIDYRFSDHAGLLLRLEW